MTIDLSTLGPQLEADLNRLMPGCTIAVRPVPALGLVATATHDVTGRTLKLRLEGETWEIACGDSHHSGRSAYEFDSAVTFHYRHDLDFTAEHGPGTAHDYAQRVAS